MEDDGEDAYHIMDARVATWRELGPKLSIWLARIADLTRERGSREWGCLVCDLWPDGGGRLIGHAQWEDADVGLDIGFRVCANLALDELAGPEYLDTDILTQATMYIWEQVAIGAGLEPAKTAVAALRKVRPFGVYGTSYGEGPLAEVGDRIL